MANITFTYNPNPINLGVIPLGRTQIRAVDITVTENDTAETVAKNYQLRLDATDPFVVETVLGWSDPGGAPANHTFAERTVSVIFGTPVTVRAYIRALPLAGSPSDVVADDLAVTLTHVADVFNDTVPMQFEVGAGSTAAIAMVLDRSGSMATDVAGVTRAERLRAACRRCFALMAQTERLAVASFNENATNDIMLGAKSAVAAQANALFASGSAGLEPGGLTSIGDGVFNANGLLSAVSDRNILVLTDGWENQPRFLSDPAVTPLLGTDVYAIGLGDASAVSLPALETLAAGPDTYVLVTGDITGNQRFKLDKYFIQILFDIKNGSIVTDPEATIAFGKTHTWEFPVTEIDYVFDAIVLTDHPEALDFDLVTPKGKVLDSAAANQAAGISFTRGPGILFFHFSTKPHVGTWKARIRIDKAMLKERKIAPVPYAFLTASEGDLKLSASLNATGINVGADMLVSATLSEGGLPMDGRSSITARVTFPGGAEVQLASQKSFQGRFDLKLPTTAPGLYTVHIVATGKTLKGTPVTREATRTIRFLPAGASQPVATVSNIETPGYDPGRGGPLGGEPAGGTKNPGGAGGTKDPGGSYTRPGTRGSLDELFARFPDLKTLLERCCGHDHHGHGHGHCGCHHAECCCPCHRR